MELSSEEGFLLLHDDDVERGYEYFWEIGFGDAGSVAFVMTFSF